MKTLTEYPCILKTNKLVVRMPFGSTVLTFKNRSGTVYCYALASTAPPVDLTFLYVKAPAQVPDNAVYITTVQLSGQRHVFGPV